jgi:hypothetical protein
MDLNKNSYRFQKAKVLGHLNPQVNSKIKIHVATVLNRCCFIFSISNHIHGPAFYIKQNRVRWDTSLQCCTASDGAHHQNSVLHHAPAQKRIT